MMKRMNAGLGPCCCLRNPVLPNRMERPMVKRLLLLAIPLILLAGCAAMQPPTGTEADYPKIFPPMKGLGSQCKDLDGFYENHGHAVDAQGNIFRLRLSDILEDANASAAKTVSFSVSTKRIDRAGDTFSSLYIKTDQSSKGIARTFESFCIKEVLFFVASIEGGATTLPFASRIAGSTAWGTQLNVWLNHGADGLLIIKIGKYTAAATGVIPYYSETIFWARFQKIRQ